MFSLNGRGVFFLFSLILTIFSFRLSDLRHGRCVYGFFYNQVACCSGLDREQWFIA